MFGLRLPRPLSYVHAQPPKLSGFAVHPGGKAPEVYHWRLQSDTSSKSLKDSCDEPVTLTLRSSSSRTSTFSGRESRGVVVGLSSLNEISNGSVVIGIGFRVGSGCREAHRIAFAIS